MYCTKCGNELLDGDRFCSKCGAEVRQATQSKYSDVIFNPPFKVEAKKKTEEILGFAATTKKEEPAAAPKREAVNFNWEMDDIPAARPKKQTQNVDFNWGEVVEQKRRESRGLSLEKIDFNDESSVEHIRVNLGKTQEFTLEDTQKKLDEKLGESVTVVGFSQPAKTLITVIDETQPELVSEVKIELDKNILKAAESEQIVATKDEKLDQMLKDAGLIDELPYSEKDGALEEQAAEKKTIENRETADAKEPKVIQSAVEISEDVLNEKIRPEEVEALAQKSGLATEKVEFNWSTGEVISTPIDESVEESDHILKDDVISDELPNAEEDDDTALPIEELEKEIFEMDGELKDKGDSQEPKGDEKFYTYNQKRGAFDQLLEQEKVKLQDLEESYNKDKENLDYTWVSEVLPEIAAENEAKKNGKVYVKKNDKKQDKKHDKKHDKPVAKESAKAATKNEFNNPSNPSTEVSKDATIVADAKEIKKAAERKPKPDQRPVTEKKDLTGIFDAIEAEEEEEKKSGCLARFVITILVLLLIVEGALFGIKLLAPDSKISQFANDTIVKLIDKVTGREQVEEPDVSEPDENLPELSEHDQMLSDLVQGVSNDMKTIGTLTYNPDLKYGNFESYFEDVATSTEFNDTEWYKNEDGEGVSYGEVLMASIVEYFDNWQETNTDKKLVGINTLEFGETRIGDTGFYTFVRIHFAKKDGSETSKVRTVYTEIKDKKIIVEDVQAEKNYKKEA